MCGFVGVEESLSNWLHRAHIQMNSHDLMLHLFHCKSPSNVLSLNKVDADLTPIDDAYRNHGQQVQHIVRMNCTEFILKLSCSVYPSQ